MSANSLLVATAELRWVRRGFQVGSVFLTRAPVLQQYFTDPLGVSGKGEWRDVPTVRDGQQGFTEPPTLEN